MNAPATVIFHNADMDGIFCREIAKKFLPPDTQFIGWNFGDTLIHIPEGTIYILDLSPDCLDFSPIDMNRIVWIDHHKTAIEKYPTEILGYRIDGVAACRLAWQWFAAHQINEAGLPSKQMFIDRKVPEPLAVRLAGEYDIWDKRDPNAETFQYALRCSPITPTGWDALLSYDEAFVKELLHDGDVAQRYAKQVDASVCKHRTWIMNWEGLNFLCVNSARFNSLFFESKDSLANGHNALMGFCWDGKQWTVSLYHAKNWTDIDLSEIAKKYGGGGHKGACGFTCKELPFKL